MFAPSKRAPSARTAMDMYGRNEPTAQVIKAAVAVDESDNVRAVLLNDETASALGIPVTLYDVPVSKLDQVQIGRPLTLEGKACPHVKPGAEFL